MTIKGFKLTSENGELRVAHGHGHYHGRMMHVLEVDKLVDELMAKATTQEEKDEIKAQAEALYETIKDAKHLESMKILSDNLKAKVDSL